MFSRRDGDDSVLPIESDDPSSTPPMASFTVSLVLFFLIGSAFAVLFLFLRRRRRFLQQTANLPSYNTRLHQRRGNFESSTSIQTSVLVYDENQNLISKTSNNVALPVPEIHLTFAEEGSSTDARKGPRVVVVRMGETGSVGMEPVAGQDDLPPYRASAEPRFESLDLERMGGLREKETSGQRWS